MSRDLATTAREYGLDDKAIRQIETYRDRLAESAQQFNLTAVRDVAGIERRHLIESLAFAALLRERGLLQPGDRVIDIGTGAGLPGLPVKLAAPEVHMVLSDSLGKRCAFLREVIAEAGIEGIEVIAGRAEDLGRDPALRDSFDLVIARAVAALPVLLEYCLPFLRPGGILAATKGSAGQAEVEASGAALKALQGNLEEIVPFQAPDGLPQSVVFVRKLAETPDRYPRRAGIPSRRPIA